MDLNYHHLHYFQAVAHEGNLTRAAEKLNISQSAVSAQIKQLENRLGHNLFTRTGRTLHLTEAGRIALDHADEIFANGRDLVATLRHKGAQRQALRIGSLSTLSRNFQMAFLRPVLGRTDIEIILRSGSAAELLSALATLNLDLVLTNQPPATDALTSFIVHPLDRQAVSLIGTPELCPPGLSLSERLASAPLILPTKASGLRMDFDALVDRLGVQPLIVAEVDDMAMLRLLTREGIGLAALPPIVVRDELASGSLIESAELPDISESFYGVTAKRRFSNALLKQLLHKA